MATKLTCARCAKPMHKSHSSRPQGEAVCHPCRRDCGGIARSDSGNILVERECAQCGASLQRRRDEVERYPRSFCDLRCRSAFGSALSQAQADPASSRKGRICEVCSSSFDASYADQRTCGRVCGEEIRTRKQRKRWPSCRIYVVECPGCTELFVARTSNKRVCSQRCWQRVNRGMPTHPCIECGQGRLPATRRKCEACLASTRRERRYRDKARRRALKRGVQTEPISLHRIAVRDRYLCGLCGKRVAMTKTAPHLKAPSLDHVIPLAEGGDHLKANVQLAHFGCNVAKRDRGSQQLALIG